MSVETAQAPSGGGFSQSCVVFVDVLSLPYSISPKEAAWKSQRPPGHHFSCQCVPLTCLLSFTGQCEAHISTRSLVVFMDKYILYVSCMGDAECDDWTTSHQDVTVLLFPAPVQKCHTDKKSNQSNRRYVLIWFEEMTFGHWSNSQMFMLL